MSRSKIRITNTNNKNASRLSRLAFFIIHLIMHQSGMIDNYCGGFAYALYAGNAFGDFDFGSGRDGLVGS